ncbi:hypothetical protein E4U41_006881 [Claviceps citrina]|nr:hypothetical protein E4U41_006881 [Claviceps citrina]
MARPPACRRKIRIWKHGDGSDTPRLLLRGAGLTAESNRQLDGLQPDGLQLDVDRLQLGMYHAAYAAYAASSRVTLDDSTPDTTPDTMRQPLFVSPPR